MTLHLRPAPRTVQETKALDQFAAVTTDSIRAAHAAMLRERQQLEAEFGIRFDPFRDGHVVHAKVKQTRSIR